MFDLNVKLYNYYLLFILMVFGDIIDWYRVCCLVDYFLVFFYDFYFVFIFVGIMMVLVNVFVILFVVNFNMMGFVLVCKLRIFIFIFIL